MSLAVSERSGGASRHYAGSVVHDLVPPGSLG